ncbi:MAG: hypothetical protein M1536_08585, partial [Firmicutes bacterium]|nr:hypothetical protein [Bacillota bacterium]
MPYFAIENSAALLRSVLPQNKLALFCDRKLCSFAAECPAAKQACLILRSKTLQLCCGVSCRKTSLPYFAIENSAALLRSVLPQNKLA